VLSEIRIQGLGVIADATLDPCDGFTVITGETGAGKTMVVAGLGLLLGGKADATRVRAGADKAVVEGRLRLPPREPTTREPTTPGLTAPELAEVIAQLDELGAELDSDGSLIVSRTVNTEGRTKAHAGGRSVPAGTLAAVGELLVTVHGQAQQLRLLRPGQQRAMLDSYGGTELLSLRHQHRQSFQRWRSLETELADWTSQAQQRTARAQELTHGLTQIDAVDPKPGEDVELREESGRLEHAETLRMATLRAHHALAGDPIGSSEDIPDAAALLGTVRGELHAVTQFDPTLEHYAQRADELSVLGADLAADLASYTESLAADPHRLAAVHDRRAALSQLTRSYGGAEADIDAVLRWAAQARDALAGLDTSSTALTELRQESAAEHARLSELSAALSHARTDASRRFGDEVTAELIGLAMPHASITAQVTRREATQAHPAVELDERRVAVSPDGVDEVELLLVAHTGAPPLPLQRGASGGELSRVMLAIEVVLAGVSSPGAMVFDEVDAGVGGKAAVEVGRRLARLARRHQVLVVTHLPQVAAFADSHVVVVKDADGSVTTSGLRVLEPHERLKELARMFAGLESSEAGIAHAAELLEMARETA